MNLDTNLNIGLVSVLFSSHFNLDIYALSSPDLSMEVKSIP